MRFPKRVLFALIMLSVTLVSFQRGTSPAAAVAGNSLVGWGYNADAEVGDGTTVDRLLPVVATSMTDVTTAAVGANYSVATRSNGSVWSWGDNSVGQLGDGTTTNRVAPVQVSITNAIAVAAGQTHTLALKSDGTVWAWGENGGGQLGDNSTTQRLAPVQSGTLTGVVAIAAGYSHSLALKSDGSLWAWGTNESGQLGDATTTTRLVPTQVRNSTNTGNLTGVAAIAAGGAHSVAVTTAGAVWAWGANGFGQLGDTTTTDRTLPVAVRGVGGTGTLAGITAVAAGQSHSLALATDGSVYAFGFNGDGELGDNTDVDAAAPVRVVGAAGATTLTGIASIAAGASQSYALKPDGTIWAWGNNANGSLGDNTTLNRRAPGFVHGVGGATLVATGANASHALAIAPPTSPATGALVGWGTPNYYETPFATTPTLVPKVGGLKSVDAGPEHTLALLADGTIQAWGRNGHGRLGDGTTNDRFTPAPVKDANGTGVLSNVIAVAAGDAHSLALKADGTVWAWGSNFLGQLGDNSSIDRLIPVQVHGAGGTGVITNVIAIAAGAAHSIALKADGTAWVWGRSTIAPVQVVAPGGLTVNDVTAVSAGGAHSLLLRAGGAVWAAGSNSDGQIGNNNPSTGNFNLVQVVSPDGTGSLNDVIAIVASDVHSLALKADGTVFAWGSNAYGALGDNTNVHERRAPVQVVGVGGVGVLTGVVAIAAGTNSEAMKSDGSLWTWGFNDVDARRDGSEHTPYSPLQVPGIVGATELAAGGTQAFAVVPLGQLRVATSPALPTQISVDGRPADSWGLTWVKMLPGPHTISFSHIEGFTEPAPQVVNVVAGATTVLNGTFVPRGGLRVLTSPAVGGTITVDGIARDAWGMWTDVPTGAHSVCFGAVAGLDPPACQNATVTAGALTTITATYTSNPSAPGAVGKGLLRATTTPALPAQISINGVVADQWGLTWPELAPGTYTVTASHLEGYDDPPAQLVTITAGQTTFANFTYVQRGTLRVVTSPAVPGTVLLNRVPLNDWGSWTDRSVGSYSVCFLPAPGFVNTPPCQTANVTAGALTTITGTYS